MKFRELCKYLNICLLVTIWWLWRKVALLISARFCLFSSLELMVNAFVRASCQAAEDDTTTRQGLRPLRRHYLILGIDCTFRASPEGFDVKLPLGDVIWSNIMVIVQKTLEERGWRIEGFPLAFRIGESRVTCTCFM